MVNEEAKFRLASRRFFNTHGFCCVHEFIMFKNGLQYYFQLCDFWFLLWCKWYLRSSEFLHSVSGNSIPATTYLYENTTLCCTKFQDSKDLIYYQLYTIQWIWCTILILFVKYLCFRIVYIALLVLIPHCSVT